jgi:hypothetical protein
LLFSYFYLHRTFPFQLQTMQRLRGHRRASNIQCIGERALTRHMPAMEANLHGDYLVVLWNKPCYNWCFTDHIVRYTFDKETYRQVRECMQRYETRRYCTFGHVCFNNVSVTTTSGEAPTYVAKEDRHTPISQWVRNDSGITCSCPHVASLQYNQGELITICCLKHSTWQIIQPTFRRFSERTKYKILLWLKDFADEGETSRHWHVIPEITAKSTYYFSTYVWLCTSTYLQMSFSIIVCGTM